MFYFFFFSALGSIFPYISLFFKQLRLSPQQTGLLTGVRPLVQCIANPVWGLVVDKTNISKISLLVGVIGWLFTYMCIGFIPSHGITSNCHIISSEIANNSVDMKESQLLITNISHWKSRRPWSESNETGHRISHDKIISDKKQFSSEISRQILNSDYASSNATVSTKDDINLARKNLFLKLLLVIAFGNLLSAPAQTMANIATLQALSKETYKYGKQRLFGSMGWGLTAFVVGAAIGVVKRGSRECGENRVMIDYRPCFYVFGTLMTFAFIAATFLKLTKEEGEENRNVSILTNIRKQIDFTTAYLLVTATYCGFALGFIETFLFWHLQDLGGTQLLFSIITGVNSFAEMTGFFFSEHLIERCGHLNVIVIGLFSSTVQMLCYGLVKNPWFVLPVEVLKSLVVSCTWTALVSYVGIRRGSVATLQTTLHALYWGFGYASGGIIGGFFVHKFGTTNVFFAMTVCGGLNAFFLILVINRKDACCKRGGYQDLAQGTPETDIEVE